MSADVLVVVAAGAKLCTVQHEVLRLEESQAAAQEVWLVYLEAVQVDISDLHHAFIIRGADLVLAGKIEGSRIKACLLC